MKKSLITLSFVLFAILNSSFAHAASVENTINKDKKQTVNQTKFVRVTSEEALSISIDELKSEISNQDLILSDLKIIEAKEINDNEIEY